MRTKMIYEGKNDYSDYSTFVFVINGKGDWGNGESWNEAEYNMAENLAQYIVENTCSTEPIFEGCAIWFCNSDKYGITDWKEEVKEAYKEWKKLNR